MKILVCIKQVPDMESRFVIDETATWYSRNDLAWRMNEYDEYAVEQAVRVKEERGDAHITVLCVGGKQVKETMKKALAMGCDRGVHIEDDHSHLRDSWEIASLISHCAGSEGYDLIFTGMQSQDRGSGQVGIIIGTVLSLPCVSTIVDFTFRDNAIEVKRELEGGVKARVKVQYPALFTCQLGLNSPRYPTLPNIMKAKKKEIVTIPVSDIPSKQPVTCTVETYIPEKKSGGIVLEGEISELTDDLIAVLKEKTSILA